jgi:phytoene synthase
MSDAAQKILIRRGFLLTKEITRKNAKTFYLASLFLPRKKRFAAYAVYAICRESDESVDSLQESHKFTRLAKIKLDIQTAYSQNPPADPLLLAFRNTVKEYAIPHEYFEELIRGMEMDLTKDRYSNFHELYDYSYKAAGVIGLIMLRIFDSDSPQIRQYALDLGTAMQLTNIIRDIREDLQRGRIYLPQDEMAAFGISDTDIKTGKIKKEVKDLIRFQIERTRQYYRNADTGIRMIRGWRSRLVAKIMSRMYSAILSCIERSDYDVISKKITLSNSQKAARLIGIIFGSARV